MTNQLSAVPKWLICMLSLYCWLRQFHAFHYVMNGNFIHLVFQLTYDAVMQICTPRLHIIALTVVAIYSFYFGLFSGTTREIGLIIFLEELLLKVIIYYCTIIFSIDIHSFICHESHMCYKKSHNICVYK